MPDEGVSSSRGSGLLTDKQDLIRKILYSIRRLIQGSELYTKELNKKYQISTPQLNCLLALFEYGSMPPSQIARHIMVNSSTVTGIIDRLEQKDLVLRVRKNSDRRLISIELTQQGLLLAQKAPPPIQLEMMNGLNTMSPDQLLHIASGFDMLMQLLDLNGFDPPENGGRTGQPAAKDAGGGTR